MILTRLAGQPWRGRPGDALLAGLGKLGISSPDRVELATLERAGHVSAVARD